MKKLVTSLICCLPIVSFAAVQNAANSLAQHLDFTSYSADFTQSILQKNNQLKPQSSGKMQLLRPSYFRWETSAPTKQIIIADQKQLKIYDVDLMQVTEEPVDASQAFNPARLLSISSNNLDNDFAIKFAKLPNCQQAFSMQDTKAQDSPLVYLCFNNNKLTQMRMLNNLGESNIFNFNNIKVNPKLPAQTFIFQLPPGVDVVRR